MSRKGKADCLQKGEFGPPSSAMSTVQGLREAVLAVGVSTV